MNITVETPFDLVTTYDDLDDGAVFISFDRDCGTPIPNIFMKVVDYSSNFDKPDYYVVDLQTGELYSDVYCYPVDKVINDEFVMEFT